MYYFDIEAAHSADYIGIGFRATGLQGLYDESWGVDDIVVTVGDAPASEVSMPGPPLDPHATATPGGAIISWTPSPRVGAGIDRYRIVRYPAPS